jgi:phenylpropionate dioxygenase-like ring-hydroxylating dioxygenase large terminal subunit
MWSITSAEPLESPFPPCTDPVALDQWYAVAAVAEMRAGREHQSLVLGHVVTFGVDASGSPSATSGARDLPTQLAYGYLWTSLGSPPPLFEIAEVHEPDRRTFNAGTIGVAVSAPRAIENFLDMGHFPFVHTGALGDEPYTEVADYDVEIVDGEVLATNCKFPQPQAAAGSTDAIVAEYTYRVPHPYCVLLTKTNPFEPRRMDVIGLFVVPLGEEHCRASMMLSLIDPVSTDAEIRRFQLGIFGQDKPILEHQVPKRLPLDVGAEISIRADRSAIAYRRHLIDLGITYGVIRPAAV